jgi:hypothetical protein
MFAHASTRLAAAVLITGLTLLAVLEGFRTGYRVIDLDEAVYRNTLVSMRAGEGYYQAMRDAVEVKEGGPPRSIRAIRPPTMFLFLRWFPEGSWRWLSGGVFFGILLATWHLGRPYGPFGGAMACALAALWVLAASSFLFLHAEVWGLPLFLAGILAFRRRNDPAAATLVAAATTVRELYGLGLVIGLLFARRRRPWIVAILVIAGLTALHALLARSGLTPTGREVPLGNEPITLSFILRALSPGSRPAAWPFGLIGLGCGIAGLVRRRVADPAARLLLPFVAIMAVATVAATRVYWALTWGPAIAAFVPAAFWRSSASKTELDPSSR